MHGKFTYSHTIRRDEEHMREILKIEEEQAQAKRQEPDHDDLDDLFRIGSRQILPQKQDSRHRPIIVDSQSSSSESAREKKHRKQKKQKKQKKDKKNKKKEKKIKKNKNKQQNSSHDAGSHKDQHSQDDTPIQSGVVQATQLFNVSLDPMAALEHKMKLLTKYQKQLASYDKFANTQILDQQFALKQKLSENALPIDIIKFGLPELYAYGPQDREIPRYTRHLMLRTVIGLRKKKHKMRKLMKQLNIVNNQRPFDWARYENGGVDRYFHFEGYDRLQGQTPQRYILKASPTEKIDSIRLIEQDNEAEQQIVLRVEDEPFEVMRPQVEFEVPADMKVMLPTAEQKLRAVNRQYNIALNQNPHNIRLWLKFLDIQDRVMELSLDAKQLGTSVQQRSALLQRKLAIVSKALEKNNGNEDLGLKYLELLADAKKDTRLIEAQTKKLLEAHPQSEELWRFFIFLKLSNIVGYRHSRLQKELEEVNEELFDRRINQVNAGREACRIRKCGLLLLEKMLKVHRLEGYHDLCTAICCALLEFNIFCGPTMLQLDRQLRVQQFKAYWEQFEGFKLGEAVHDGHAGTCAHSWEGYLLREGKKYPGAMAYIGDMMIKGKLSASSTKQLWLPAHSLHSQQQIALSPESFILFEDLQIYLHTFGNRQNWRLVCNLTLANLGMPPVYHRLPQMGDAEESAHLTQWLANTLLSPGSSPSPYTRHSVGSWSRYWHPLLTHEYLATAVQTNQFIYGLNIIEILYQKFQELGQRDLVSPVREYLTFLYGCLYCLRAGPSSPELRHLAGLFPADTCIGKIQGLLTAEPSNMNMWCMYIEFEMLSGKSVSECLNCYLNCISAMGSQQDQQLRLIQQIEAVYCISEFLYRHGHLLCTRERVPNTRNMVLQLLNFITMSTYSPQDELSCEWLLGRDHPLTQMEKLLLGNRLKQICGAYTKAIQQTKKVELLVPLVQAYYMLIELGQNTATIVPLLLNLYSLATHIELPIEVLVDHGLLTLEHVGAYNMLTSTSLINNLKIVTYVGLAVGSGFNRFSCAFAFHLFRRHCWTVRKKIKTSTQQVHTADPQDEDYYDQPSKNRLYMWLLLMRVLEPHSRALSHWEHHHLVEYFLRHGQSLISSHEPVCVELLNRLLSDPDFSFECLSQFPYCRQLYELAAVKPALRPTVHRLILQKEIRLPLAQG